jgi:hypothetical protein
MKRILSTTKILLAVSFLISLLILGQAAQSSAASTTNATPVITSVAVDFTAKSIIIGGANFTSRSVPIVTLGSYVLQVISATATQIVASMPAAVLQGDYLLKVSVVSGSPANTAFCTYALTIGSIGPPGPKGDKGDTGAKGDTGPGCSQELLDATCQAALRSGNPCPSFCNCESAKIVFLSSEAYAGNSLGGIDGADAKCQTLATAAGLSGTFKAWISSGIITNPKARFTRGNGPYTLVDGTVVANNWYDLTDGELINAIDLDEKKVRRNEIIPVWTATAANGETYLAYQPQTNLYAATCGRWTSGGECPAECVGFVGASGNAITNSAWTTLGTDYTVECQYSANLYCFEQ